MGHISVLHIHLSGPSQTFGSCVADAASIRIDAGSVDRDPAGEPFDGLYEPLKRTTQDGQAMGRHPETISSLNVESRP